MKFTRPLVALALATGMALLPLPGSTAQAADTGSDPVLTCFPHAQAPTRYSDSWGASRSGGRSHKGTDLLTEKGIEVVAAADGVITRMRGDGGLSGYGIVIDHGGWETHYLHLNNDTPGSDDGNGGPENAFAAELVEGSEVKAGQVIAYAGDSGNAEWTSPHTHFELHIDGGAVNPYPYLADVAQRNDDFVAAVAALGTAQTDAADKEAALARATLTADPSTACLPAATLALLWVGLDLPTLGTEQPLSPGATVLQ